jgi:polar amino acid transport system substrate-binding protein
VNAPCAFVVAAGANTALDATAQQAERLALAPGGKLRVGVYPGSPLSMVRDRVTGEFHGLTLDLGKYLAGRLDVPLELATYQRIAEVLAGIKAQDVDFTISNATPARAVDVAFSQTLLSLELGYLVSATSKVKNIADVDQPGVRVGVATGSTSERTLPKMFGKASVVPAQNLERAIAMLQRAELDVFATNKPILFEMSDAMPGSRVFDGRWGEEHIAIAIPKGREQAMQYLRRFVEDVRTGGVLAQIADRAGLRGLAAADK